MVFNHMMTLYISKENPFNDPDTDIISYEWSELKRAIDGVASVLDQNGCEYSNIIFDGDFKIYFIMKEAVPQKVLDAVRDVCGRDFVVGSMDEKR